MCFVDAEDGSIDDVACNMFSRRIRRSFRAS